MKTTILTIITIITLSFNSPDNHKDGYNRGFKTGYRDAS